MKNLLYAISTAALLAANSAHALTIDDFDGGNGEVIANGSSTFNYANALGGSRRISITKNGLFGAGAEVAAGLFAQSTGFGTSAESAISWSEVGIDLTEGLIDNVFNYQFVALDQGEVTIILTVTDGAGTSASVSAAPVLGHNTLSFASFGGVDFENVNEITMSVISGQATDLVLDSVTTSGTRPPPPANVPVPSTLLLAGLGLLGLRAGHRRSA